MVFSCLLYLHLLNAGLKCAQQGAIMQRAQLRPELNTDLSPCSVICCRLLLPGDNCIAVRLWLMSCRCNCFTVWPLVFQTRGLVKDLLWADEGWERGWGASVFLLVCFAVAGGRINMFVLSCSQRPLLLFASSSRAVLHFSLKSPLGQWDC